MKDKLKAIACLGLAVCVASGLWACSKEDVQTEPESSNTTINYVYNGIYDISNIPEETLSGEMPVTEIETDTNGETYIRRAQRWRICSRFSKQRGSLRSAR